jgi:hypothetical protein
MSVQSTSIALTANTQVPSSSTDLLSMIAQHGSQGASLKGSAGPSTTLARQTRIAGGTLMPGEFNSMNDLLSSAGRLLYERSRNTGLEAGGVIVRNSSGKLQFIWVDGFKGPNDAAWDPGGLQLPDFNAVRRAGFQVVGDLHTHPLRVGVEGPSSTDIVQALRNARKAGRPVENYVSAVVAADGDLLRYIPEGNSGTKARIVFIKDVNPDLNHNDPRGVITNPISDPYRQRPGGPSQIQP